MRSAEGHGKPQRGWQRPIAVRRGKGTGNSSVSVDVELGSTVAENSRPKNAFENCWTNFGVG